HHAGAMVPHFAGRLASPLEDPRRDDITSRLAAEPIDYFRRFFADTALSGPVTRSAAPLSSSAPATSCSAPTCHWEGPGWSPTRSPTSRRSACRRPKRPQSSRGTRPRCSGSPRARRHADPRSPVPLQEGGAMASSGPAYERLGAKILSLPDVIAQSVGFMGPVFSSAFVIPL